jgi:predicted acetyltransferase
VTTSGERAIVRAVAGPITIRALREDEREAARALQRRAFNVSPSAPVRAPEPPLDSVWVAEETGAIAGVLRVHRFGHFFGGRSVQALGIGGVAVAPEARGRRVAERLVVEVLREFRRRGFAISTLFPATVPVYRRCGYEYMSLRVRFRVPLRSLPRAAGPEVVPWTDEHLGEVAACYRAWAVGQNGVVDRPERWWPDRVLLAHEGGEVFRYCVREGGAVTGYLVYTQATRGDVADWSFDLNVRDLVWTTPAAAASLLAFAGRHRSNAVDLVWTGPPNDPLANLLVEQDAGFDSWFRQMIRIVDVAAAFEARGYPAGLARAVELSVEDPHVADNALGWRVEVAGGRARVSPAPGAGARVDVATLGAMWSGMLAPADARRLGKLVADDDTVEGLGEMFAGPVPWINDWF